MSTDIEWTDETWNPVTGCTKVSPGCDHCYAERVTERFHGKGSFDRVVLHSDRLAKPYRWRRPRRVFVNSMSDLFHAAVPIRFVADVFAVMAINDRHTFQVLTKRHDRMRSLLNSSTFWSTVEQALHVRGADLAAMTLPLPNVHLLVSVEDQKRADLRIPALLETPAVVRGLSCEPLLGPIDLDFMHYYDAKCNGCSGLVSPAHEPMCGVEPGAHWGLDWVIVGGESGPGARPMQAQWARALRDQCTAAGVPFLFKQWGGRTPKAGGRELDGQTWDQYPEAVAS